MNCLRITSWVSVPVLLGTLILGLSASAESSTAESASKCYALDIGASNLNGHVPGALSFDRKTGVSLKMNYLLPGYHADWIVYKAVLPKTIGGEPNPDFDRLYSLLLKGMEMGSISEICLENGKALQKDTEILLNSLTVDYRAISTPMNVRVCDPYSSRCARVDEFNRLNVKSE